MAPPRRLLQAAVVAACVSLAGSSGAGQARVVPGGRVDLQPGIGIVDSRDQQRIRLRLDPDSPVFPAQLQGTTVLVRRLVTKVYLPQSWRAFAEEWQENGAARVLPIHRTGGELMAHLLWEDVRRPVKAGDRVELCRVPPEAAKPVILSLRGARPGDTGQGGKPVAAPGEILWLEADVLCPTGRSLRCEWAADAGEFLHAGGTSSGQGLKGPPVVRWRAPAAPGQGGKLPGKATIGLKAFGGFLPEPAERTLVVRIEMPQAGYREVQCIRTRVPGPKGGDPGPLFTGAAGVAAGARGSFYLVDGPGKRLLHYGQGVARYVALGGSAVGALAAFDGAAYVLQDGAVQCWAPGAEALTRTSDPPEAKRLAGVGFNAAGDLCVLDSGAPPRLLTLARGERGAWQAAPLGPGVDSPWLSAFCVEPQSNDVYLYDSRERMVRQWRALQGRDYRMADVPIGLDEAVGKFGAPVELLPVPGCDCRRELPIQVVFKSGAVTETWRFDGEPAKWTPEVAATAGELVAMQFAAREAVRLAAGDILLAGEGRVAGEAAPVVAQVSPAGQWRRMLPVPAMAPRSVAVAPDGLRYVLLAPRRRRGALRLVGLGPEGWVTRDVGELDGFRSAARVRAERSSASHVLVVGEKQRRESSFRLDVTDPRRCLELSSAGIPGGHIPEHRAVDAASSPEHIAVLDRDGKVLLFANRKPVAYLGDFDTGLRRPKAIAVLSSVARRADPGGERRSYVCVLPSGEREVAIHVWRLRAVAGGKQGADAIGAFPDPKRAGAAAQLSSPVAMVAGFPDRQELLYVLDRGGAQVRAFDVAEIGWQLSSRLPPKLEAEPLVGGLKLGGEGLDLAVGPGQVVHIADAAGHTIHSYARRP